MIDTHERYAPATVVLVVSVWLGLWAILLLVSPYSTLLSLALKVSLWGIPSYVFARLASRAQPAEFLRLVTPPRGRWIWMAAVFLTGYAAVTGGGSVRLHLPSLSFVVSAVLVSPLVEEVAFRGMILQSLMRGTPFWVSNSVTAVLFLLYHLPLWVARGHGASVLGSLWILLFALFLGICLRRTRSLWTCIAIHATQNLVFGVMLTVR